MGSNVFFDAVYRRADHYYGHAVRPDFAAFVEALPPGARCLDLGCGQGRHALFAARRGRAVHAVDYSAVAVDQLAALARGGLPVEAELADATRFTPPAESYDAVFMVSFLSHLDRAEAERIAAASFGWLKPGGAAYVEAFTTLDPAYAGEGVASETGTALRCFFPPGSLPALFAGFELSHQREFVENDLTHGPAHRHGVSLLVARRPVTQAPR